MKFCVIVDVYALISHLHRNYCALLGISLQGVKTYILHNYAGVDPNTLRVRVTKALDECLKNGLIRKPETSDEQPAVLDKAGPGCFLNLIKIPWLASCRPAVLRLITAVIHTYIRVLCIAHIDSRSARNSS